MKSAKKIIAIAIVAIILVGGGLVFGVKKASLKKAEITSDIIEERLVEAKELTSLKYKSEYRGPKNTEQTMFTKCAVGQNPSILSIGDITTPIATIMASVTILNKCFSLNFFSY